LIRTLLRFEPAVPDGRVWFAPALPPGLGDLAIDRVALADTRVGLTVTGATNDVTGLPPGIALARGARPAVRPDQAVR
jgi:hypothetical protein